MIWRIDSSVFKILELAHWQWDTLYSKHHHNYSLKNRILSLLLLNPLQRKPLSCITKYESIGYILLFWSNSEKNQKKSFVPEKLKILKN